MEIKQLFSKEFFEDYCVKNLKIKASGGVSNLKDCLELIKAGASRIGTSKAKIIYNEK